MAMKLILVALAALQVSVHGSNVVDLSSTNFDEVCASAVVARKSEVGSVADWGSYPRTHGHGCRWSMVTRRPSWNSLPHVCLVRSAEDMKSRGASCDPAMNRRGAGCGHCKSLAPAYEEVGDAFAKSNSVIIAKVTLAPWAVCVCVCVCVCGGVEACCVVLTAPDLSKYLQLQSKHRLVSYVDKQSPPFSVLPPPSPNSTRPLLDVQVLKPADKQSKYSYGGNGERAITPMRPK